MFSLTKKAHLTKTLLTTENITHTQSLVSSTENITHMLSKRADVRTTLFALCPCSIRNKEKETREDRKMKITQSERFQSA